MSADLKTVSLVEFQNHLVKNKSLIDVRAPVEFKSGSIPGSVNIPILDDEERVLVGTCYKQQGSEKAIQLGYRLVSGENKNLKQKKWLEFLKAQPDAVITCFRGGQRSQITQKFLLEMGIEVLRIEKGYKEVRQFFLDQLHIYATTKKMILLTGLTGSAKTRLLGLTKSFYPTIDLEDLAKHRGSAFGNLPQPQPSQADFENKLATELLRLEQKKDERRYLFEDESRLIGRVHLPEALFENLRNSPVILVKQSLAERVENIYKDYITDALPSEKLFDSYEYSLEKIEKRLGGLKTKEIMTDLKKSKSDFLDNRELESNRVWIEKLLVHYYDILYSSSFAKRRPPVLFEGSHNEVLEFLRRLKS